MGGRMGLLVASAALYSLCISLPVVIVEQITGFWSVMDRAAEGYLAMLANPTYEAANEWAMAWSGKLSLSVATWLFMLVVPGPLELGLSAVWLRVLRGKEAFADMVFSGFGNFLRAMLLHLSRAIFVFLWSVLLVVPGVIAMYRYSLAFFLLADNPGMAPFAALTYSKYYMQGNKGNRFVLDLTFLGWAALGAVLLSVASSAIIAGIDSSGHETGFFIQYLVSTLLGAVVIAPLTAYRGVACAEYYHRVICRDPRSFPDKKGTHLLS